MVTVIFVGSSQGTLTFDKPVTLLLAGVTGTVGYKPFGSDTWVQITNTCGGDYTTPTFVSNECSINNETNTKILTNHFTTFGSLTAIPAAAAASPGGGGGGPLPASNAYANWQAQQTAAEPLTTPVTTPYATPSVEPQGQVLGVQHFADGAMIRANGGIDIYIVKYMGNKKFKRLILNPSVFNGYQHLKWADVLNVDQSVIDSFTTSDLVRVVGDTRVYKLTPSGDKGNKQWVKTENAFNNQGFDWSAIYEINSVDRNSYTTGADIE